MFGLWKLYKKKFEPYESGYSFRVFTGFKFVTADQRDDLISSYRKSLKFDFAYFFKSFLLMLLLILIGVLFDFFFDFGEPALTAISYIAAVPIILFAVKPHWDHFRTANQILSEVKTLPQSGSWFEKLGVSFQKISWVRIGIVLPIYGFVLYRMISAMKSSPTDWLLLILIILLGLGWIYLFFAAFWKIVLRIR